ncbi:MAG: type IV pilin [Candidatus Bathyarchaeota archaeon]|nr:type IV pilin [Candidatus Bathyarchaeota archaeon]
MNYRKFRKSTKALSPVVASIILIAVTVAVSVVVAAWMGGMTIGLMGNAEQVQVSNTQFAQDAKSVTLTVRNTGGATVTISSATIDGKTVTLTPAATEETPEPTPGPVNIAKGTSADFMLSLSASSDPFNAGSQYEIKLVTAKGTTVVYTATYNPIS